MTATTGSWKPVWWLNKVAFANLGKVWCSEMWGVVAHTNSFHWLKDKFFSRWPSQQFGAPTNANP
jgi:hypothetical protein